MKIFIFSAIFSLTLYSLNAQNPKEIVKKAYAKCQSIKNGYYEMTQFTKYMGDNDTSVTRHNCYFKKTVKDKISSSLFDNKSFWPNENSGEVIYSGYEFIALNHHDSTGTITTVSKWREQVKSRVEDVDLYSILTSNSDNPLSENKNSSDMIYRFLGEESINNEACYLIQCISKPQKPSAKEPLHLVRYECQFWIQKSDFLPVKYSVAIDMEMNKDTMYQYNVFALDKYEFNTEISDSIFSLSGIPAYYKLKEYLPYDAPEPLPLDSIAPDWTLTSLDNETIHLQDLKGKLVLLDFFYRSCYPCMLALPVIQSLHEKYQEKGLKVFGINPVDKEPDDLKAFLSKRGITYSVLLSTKDIAQNYKVSGYPTVFLIDKSGKLVYTDDGYSDKMGENLENIIIKNLPH